MAGHIEAKQIASSTYTPRTPDFGIIGQSWTSDSVSIPGTFTVSTNSTPATVYNATSLGLT